MARLMQRVLIVAIVGLVVCYGAGTLWLSTRVALPPPEPTTFDQVMECGYEGRQRVRAPTAACGAAFDDALRELSAQQLILAAAGSHHAFDLFAREFVETDAAGRAAKFAGWAAPLPREAQRLIPAQLLSG